MSTQVNVNSSGGAARLNASPANSLADLLRELGFGSLVRRQRTALRRQNPNAQAAGVASPWDLATLQVLFLPDDAKAFGISRAYARATGASGTLGELTVEAPNTTPANGQIAVTPAGNIAVLGSAEYTDLDVDYDVWVGDQPIVLTLPVSSNSATIPTAQAGTAGSGTPSIVTAAFANQQSANAGILVLMEVVANAGTSTGNKVVIAPGGTPSAGQACLNTAKTAITFNSGDAVTNCTVKLLPLCAGHPTPDLNAFLENNGQY